MQELLIGEKESLFLLVRGSFGYFRNPTMHRNVKMTSGEAIEAIYLANHLIKIALK